MNQSSLLEKVCRDELGLGSISSDQLQSGVKKYIEAWDVFAVPGEQFSELNDATVRDYAERYLDQGWNRDERVEKGTERGMKVAAGKHLWPRISGSKRLRYEYPKNADIICKGVEKVFHLLKHDSRDAIPNTSYPTPISAKKRKVGNDVDSNSSSETDTSDEDSPSFKKAQAPTSCNSESLFEKEQRDQQEAKDDIAFQAPTSTPDQLGPTTATFNTGNEAYAEPRQGLESSSSLKKPISIRRKSSNAKDIGGQPNQRTLREAGFTAVSKPLTPKDKRKDPQWKAASNDAGRAIHMRATSPVLVSDDESLPKSPREHFGLKNIAKESASKKEHAEVSLLTAQELSHIGTPSKRRKIGDPSIVRSSNTIKPRRLPKRPPPSTVLHTEEHRLESALYPTSAEAQLSDHPPDELRVKSPCIGPSVDDSVASHTPRELSRAPSIDLGDYQSETTVLPEESILPGLPLAENRTTSSRTSNLEASCRSESRSSVNFWVLRTSKPHNKWVHWADATLFHETIDSMFGALGDFVGNTACNTIDVQLQTPQEEYSFQLQRDRSDRFEAMKAFMLQIIDASQCARGFNHTVISIYLRLDIDLA